MNYLKAILLVTGLFVIGCSANAYTEKASFEKETVSVGTSEINDDVKSEERNLSGFDGVSVGSTISANVTVGQDFKVVVEAKESILPKVITKIKDGSLIVKFEKDWWRSLDRKSKNNGAKVTISLPFLDDLDVSGASKASVAGVNSEKMTIDVSGASNVSVEGSAREIDVDLSGASSLQANRLISEVADMDLSGASSARVNVANSLRVDASGASSVRYMGSPQISKDTSGASSVRRQ